MTEVEKRAGIDLLDRVHERLIARKIELDAGNASVPYDVEESLYGTEEWQAYQDAQNDVIRLSNDLHPARTEVGQHSINFLELADALRSFDDNVRFHRQTACDWFAIYFTNHGVNRDSFLLACGYALPEREMLLHEDKDQDEINWKE